MKEVDLLKVLIHKLANIEAEMMKRKDMEELIVQLITNEEKVEIIQETLETLKLSVETKHMENINSDELLLRSFRAF